MTSLIADSIASLVNWSWIPTFCTVTVAASYANEDGLTEEPADTPQVTDIPEPFLGNWICLGLFSPTRSLLGLNSCSKTLAPLATSRIESAIALPVIEATSAVPSASS